MTYSKLAIIGTAGRGTDKALLTAAHYNRMVKAAASLIHHLDMDPSRIILLSGGAAWADHVAVSLVIRGLVPFDNLKLFLPATLDYFGYSGEGKNQERTAETANYYHKTFSQVTGVNSIDELNEVRKRGSYLETIEAGFHARNSRVANEVSLGGALLAFTVGDPKSDQPDWTIRPWGGGVKADVAGLKDGGTAHTWGLARCPKFHARLGPIEDTSIYI